MRLTLKPTPKEFKRVLHLCLFCCLLWYSLTVTATLAYLFGWLGSIRPVDDFINNCGKDYYFSSLIIDGNQYYFDDITGCREDQKNATCVYSVKDSKINKFYNQSHEIDPLTKNLILQQPRRTVIEPNIEDLLRYPAINELLGITIKDIKKVWFMTYWKNDTIKKVFIITSANPVEYCNKQAVKILNQI